MFSAAALGVLLKRKKLSKMFLMPGMNVILVSIIAPIVQVFFLKNHSACHEFSMVKIGWIIALFPSLYALFMNYLLKDDINYCVSRNSLCSSVFLMRTLLMIMLLGYIMGQPFATQDFLKTRGWKGDFRLEEAINDITDYNDMCFSFDVQIKWNESSELAKSEKCVHMISNIDEMHNEILEAGSQLDKVYFIIDKWTENENQEIEKLKENLIRESECVYENDRYYMMQINYDQF